MGWPPGSLSLHCSPWSDSGEWYIEFAVIGGAGLAVGKELAVGGELAVSGILDDLAELHLNITDSVIYNVAAFFAASGHRPECGELPPHRFIADRAELQCLPVGVRLLPDQHWRLLSLPAALLHFESGTGELRAQRCQLHPAVPDLRAGPFARLFLQSAVLAQREQCALPLRGWHHRRLHSQLRKGTGLPETSWPQRQTGLHPIHFKSQVSQA